MNWLEIAAAVLGSTAGLLISEFGSRFFSRRETASARAEIKVTLSELNVALGKAAESQAAEGDAVGGTKGDSAPGAPGPTSSGKKEALAVMDYYMRDLVEEASRIAKRHGAEGATDVHVREAAAHIGILRSRAGVAADVGLGLGALLLGGAIAYQVNLWTGGQAVHGTETYALLALGVGLGVFVWAATTKWNKR